MASHHREMNKKYWDSLSGSYENEIWSVFHGDRQGLIKRSLQRISSKKASALDLGCGIGHFLPLMSDHFHCVYASDISKQLLNLAMFKHGHRKNIEFLCGDITRSFKKIPKVDFILSVNSLISSSANIRERLLKTIASRLKTGGHLALVVPSVESAFLVDMRFVQWKTKRGVRLSRAIRLVYPGDPLNDNKARQGIYPIDGVATRHYSKEELQFLLAAHGLKVISTKKIEYPWDTEFEAPPRWMQEPYPWDWFVVAKKI